MCEIMYLCFCWWSFLCLFVLWMCLGPMGLCVSVCEFILCILVGHIVCVFMCFFLSVQYVFIRLFLFFYVFAFFVCFLSLHICFLSICVCLFVCSQNLFCFYFYNNFNNSFFYQDLLAFGDFICVIVSFCVSVVCIFLFLPLF